MNWWLMALAFILGIVLTWLWTVRTVTREIAVHRTTPADASGQSASRTVLPGAAAAKPAAKPAPAETTKTNAPFGAGSAVAGENGVGPKGWNVKALNESKVFHTPESSSFSDIRADLWFENTEAAQAAGFHRWDAQERQGATAV